MTFLLRADNLCSKFLWVLQPLLLFIPLTLSSILHTVVLISGHKPQNPGLPTWSQGFVGHRTSRRYWLLPGGSQVGVTSEGNGCEGNSHSWPVPANQSPGAWWVEGAQEHLSGCREDLGLGESFFFL